MPDGAATNPVPVALAVALCPFEPGSVGSGSVFITGFLSFWFVAGSRGKTHPPPCKGLAGPTLGVGRHPVSRPNGRLFDCALKGAIQPAANVRWRTDLLED